jgi:hypothetical protein
MRIRTLDPDTWLAAIAVIAVIGLVTFFMWITYPGDFYQEWGDQCQSMGGHAMNIGHGHLLCLSPDGRVLSNL